MIAVELGNNELARAAIAAMLEAVGEPVALDQYYKAKERELEYYRQGAGCLTDGDRKAGWTETPLYSLSPLTQALLTPTTDPV